MEGEANERIDRERLHIIMEPKLYREDAEQKGIDKNEIERVYNEKKANVDSELAAYKEEIMAELAEAIAAWNAIAITGGAGIVQHAAPVAVPVAATPAKPKIAMPEYKWLPEIDSTDYVFPDAFISKLEGAARAQIDRSRLIIIVKPNLYKKEAQKKGTDESEINRVFAEMTANRDSDLANYRAKIMAELAEAKAAWSAITKDRE
jgi:hypothetical protein